jgi:hypothetical protein
MARAGAQAAAEEAAGLTMQAKAENKITTHGPKADGTNPRITIRYCHHRQRLDAGAGSLRDRLCSRLRTGGTTMPITSYLDGHQFDPETKRIIGIAFEMTRAALRVSNQDDLAPEIIAKIIIEFARAGERDPERLCDQALANLRAPPPQR